MKIEKIKKTGSKYKITLDSGEVINTFDDVIIENNLLFDKKIDSKLLDKIQTDTNYYEVYNKVIRLIGVRFRSENEINEYLKKSKVEEADIIKIIDSLKRIGLINDYNFARAYTNDKMNLSLDGPYKIVRELESHKIERSIINEMIESYPLELIDSHIEKIISKKLKTNKKYTGFILKQRIVSYLINQGYSREDINRHLDLIVSSPKNLENEMEKIYKKLSLKYSGDELFYKLKNKLYSKGFEISEIEKFIDEKTVH